MKEADEFGVNPWIWRVWLAGKGDSLLDIQTKWSVDDVVHAHISLDIENLLMPKLPGV